MTKLQARYLRNALMVLMILTIFFCVFGWRFPLIAVWVGPLYLFGVAIYGLWFFGSNKDEKLHYHCCSSALPSCTEEEEYYDPSLGEIK